MPGFAIESLSWCVLGMLSTYLDINGLTAFGVTTKFIKDLAVAWLKNRAMCCLDHVNRPEDWEFFLRRSPVLRLSSRIMGAGRSGPFASSVRSAKIAIS